MEGYVWADTLSAPREASAFLPQHFVFVHGRVGVFDDLVGSFSRLPLNHADGRVYVNRYFRGTSLDCVFTEYPFILVSRHTVAPSRPACANGRWPGYGGRQ